MKNLTLIYITLFIALATNAPAQSLWEDVTDLPESLARKPAEAARPVPGKYRLVKTDFERLKAYLSDVPKEDFSKGRDYGKEIELPLPDGGMGRFRVVEYSVMAPGLTVKFPEIRTYSGTGIDDPSATIKFTCSPIGFHVIILSSFNSTSFVESYIGNINFCKVYFQKDYNYDNLLGMGCGTIDEFKSDEKKINQGKELISLGGELYEFRLALAFTSGFTDSIYHLYPSASKLISAMSYAALLVNAVNNIYERNVGIRLCLVENNVDIIFEDVALDPFNACSPLPCSEDFYFYKNQEVIDSIIGNDNYDIGHLFADLIEPDVVSGANSGRACSDTNKARGFSILSDRPIGKHTFTFIHELGHAFGANHTFSSCETDSGPLPFEPGSGSTIMSYGGLCNENENIQTSRDLYFHAQSLLQIKLFLINQTCVLPLPVGTRPEFSAFTKLAYSFPIDYYIPKSTPFILKAHAYDEDGDSLTYRWDEIDAADGIAKPLSTNIQGPMFRSFPSVASGERYFPDLNEILGFSNENPDSWEVLPSVRRQLTFRAIVEDGKGNFDFEEVKIQVTNEGPLKVKESIDPISGLPNSWKSGCEAIVKWFVNGTDQGEIACPYVNILLSTDGGNTFPITLASKEINDGESKIKVPNILTNTARIKIEGDGRIFFDISDNNFSIKQSPLQILAFPDDGDVSPSRCITSNCNGSITFQVLRGKPTTFEWSHRPNENLPPPQNNLCPGLYSVTVTDENKCTATEEFEVKSQYDNLSVDLTGGNTSSTSSGFVCGNSLPLNFSAIPTGGTAPYTYSFSGGAFSNVSNYTATADGPVLVTVQDANGCQATGGVFLLTTVRILCGRDPNDILGPPGYAEAKWVSINDRLPYTVRFENDPELATAPAQKVVIEHVPDPHLNLFSVQLGDFGFANQTFTVPPNTSYYSKRLDLRDSLGVYVDVNAGIDITQNKVFWIFQAVDPATGLPPADPLLGLLPINDTLLGNGEGYVNFSIKPKSNSVTGDTVLAKAAIVFDLNETIYTPEIFNVIDAVAPTSQIVTALPATTDSTSFELCWTGQDDPGGCGVRDYALYVSQNGAPFYRYQDGIPDTCVTFTGSPGASYAFYTLATDNVGNQEAPKQQGEATISINETRDLFIYAINQNGFCAGDSLVMQWLATRIDAVDVFFSPDSGATLQPLATNLDTNLIGWRIATGYAGCSACALIVTDTAGGFSDTLFTAIHPKPVIDPVLDLTHINCNGAATGAIGITASGGTAPYDYAWNNGQTSNPADNLVAGDYTVILTDANGCADTASAVLTEPPALALDVAVANESCDPPGSDGSATLTVSGGVAPYDYLWSNGQTTTNITGLTAASYVAMVTDANGCVDSIAAVVGLGTGQDLLSTANVKVILQGPYVSAVQLMHDSLRVKGLIPLTEPYTGLTNFIHTGGGSEQTTPAVLAVTGPDAIVDWVFLELRHADTPALVLATRSALLQRDGDVVEVDGVSPVVFGAPAGQQYYIAVRHRNHLGVQLGAPVDYPVCEVMETDFRSLPPEGFYDYNGLNPAQKTVSGVFVLWAGNGRVDFQLKYNGSNNDRTAILSVVGLTTPNAIVPGYNLADYSMDGVVKYNGAGNDRNVLLGNVGITTPSAILHDQVAR